MEYLPVLYNIIQILCSICIFVILTWGCNYLVNKIKSDDELKNSKYLNPLEYFPHEEVMNLRQVFYLIMMLVFIVLILYAVFEWKDNLFYIAILDIIISLYLASKVGWSSLKDKILLLLLIPIASLTYLMFGQYVFFAVGLLHVFGYLYFIKVYYQKFVKFTENNALGISIILLFSIVLISFLFTMLAEEVSPLDSIVMVTNAFTSNSFEASGTSELGKLNSLVIAWGGFILSGVGTATLAVSLIKSRVDRQFDDMAELIKNKKK